MSKVDLVKLEELFCHHASKTKETKQKHAALNLAAIEFARTLAITVSNPAELTICLRRLQEVRMLANAAIAQEGRGLSYSSIFIQ